MSAINVSILNLTDAAWSSSICRNYETRDSDQQTRGWLKISHPLYKPINQNTGLYKAQPNPNPNRNPSKYS